MNIFANVERRAKHAFRELETQLEFSETSVDSAFCVEAEQQSVKRGIRYSLNKNLLSRVYDLSIFFRVESDLWPEGKAEWNGRSWKSKDLDLKEQLVHSSALENELISLLSQLDTRRVLLTVSEKKVKLDVHLIPGCFVWTLLPPLHYFVRLKPEEIKTINLIECAFYQLVNKRLEKRLTLN
jgi:hypothetical protein